MVCSGSRTSLKFMVPNCMLIGMISRPCCCRKLRGRSQAASTTIPIFCGMALAPDTFSYVPRPASRMPSPWRREAFNLNSVQDSTAQPAFPSIHAGLRRLETPCLGLVPVAIHLLQRSLFRAASLLGQARLHVPEAALELAVGAAQGLFRVHPELARQVRHREQHIAQLVLKPRMRGLVRHFPLQLSDLLSDLAEDRRELGPVETDPRRPLLQFLGPGQRRQPDWDAIQHALLRF